MLNARVLSLLVVLMLTATSTTLCFEILEEDDKKDDDTPDPDDPGQNGDPDNNGTVIPDPNGTIPDQDEEFPYEDVRWYTVFDPETGEEKWNSAWAIYNVTRGGNMNEHYLATTPDGWITNLGGEFPHWTEDNGLTWTDFRYPWEPGGGGEGSIISAPNGDIIAMSWYPYSGDRFVAYHYDKGSSDWTALDNRMNTVFYDRPWQVPVPGPINVAGQTFPWASIVMSNAWQDMVISVDGLVYSQLAEPSAAVRNDWDLDFDDVGREFDFMTPHHKMDACPLPGGGLLIPNHFADGDAILTTDLTWEVRSPIEGVGIPGDHLAIDSSGALHSISVSGPQLDYHLSLDGGRNWTTETIVWKESGSIEQWEFQADGHHGVAVINIVQDMGDFDEHVVYHVRDYRNGHAPDTVTKIGLGDVDTIASVGGGDDRFDFASLAIQPDGSVVVAFCDSTDIDPMFAIELQAPYE